MAYIMELGADGIMTDRVDLAHPLYVKYGWKTNLTALPQTEFFLPIPKPPSGFICHCFLSDIQKTMRASTGTAQYWILSSGLYILLLLCGARFIF